MRVTVAHLEDIRKDAEKMKSARAVHRDLDLVQRISSRSAFGRFPRPFGSIREEFNGCRIRESHAAAHGQAVKLYTRDEPILEAYGVQGRDR